MCIVLSPVNTSYELLQTCDKKEIILAIDNPTFETYAIGIVKKPRNQRAADPANWAGADVRIPLDRPFSVFRMKRLVIESQHELGFPAEKRLREQAMRESMKVLIFQAVEENAQLEQESEHKTKKARRARELRHRPPRQPSATPVKPGPTQPASSAVTIPGTTVCGQSRSF